MLLPPKFWARCQFLSEMDNRSLESGIQQLREMSSSDRLEKEQNKLWEEEGEGAFNLIINNHLVEFLYIFGIVLHI